MGDDRDEHGEHGAELLRAARRSMSPEVLPRSSASGGYESARDGLGILAGAAGVGRENRRSTIGIGRGDVETPGSPDHRAADAADLRNQEAYRRLVPPDVFRQVEDLTSAMIEQRRAGNEAMVAFNQECIKVLVRDNMSGSGAARTAVGVIPPSSVGGFTFNASAAVSVRDTVCDRLVEVV